MRKTLKDLAKYLKSILVPETCDDYEINSVVKNISNKANIHEGIRFFRSFLCHLFDVLEMNADKYDNFKKVAHEYENRTTLSVYYPFLHNVKSLLINIGYYGQFVEESLSIVCDNNIFIQKLSNQKTLECLQFLSNCGIKFEGIDLTNKKQNFQSKTQLKISYPNQPKMLIGLIVMAIAEVKLGNLLNQDVFLRCDYSIIMVEKVDVIKIIKDTIHPLSKNIQNLILNLHQRYLDKGLKCSVEIKGFYTYIKYTYRREELWGINNSLNNGYHINIKAKNMDQYLDVVETFPPILQQIIEKGYGCGRKISEIGHCNGGCRGMIIPLNDSIIDLGDYIKKWLDKEILFLN